MCLRELEFEEEYEEEGDDDNCKMMLVRGWEFLGEGRLICQRGCK